MFAYDASSGTGLGAVQPLDAGRVSMEFDPATIDIPALDFRTTKVLGLPIPPPLKISINASELKVLVCRTVVHHAVCETLHTLTSGRLSEHLPYQRVSAAADVAVELQVHACGASHVLQRARAKKSSWFRCTSRCLHWREALCLLHLLSHYDNA